MEGENFSNGFILCENGKITAIGDMAECPAVDYEFTVIDADGKSVYPGLVDPHCHIGMLEDGVAEEGEDLNEDTDPVTPHLRAADGLYLMDKTFNEALKAGVTTCVTGPGSTNVICGTFAAVKTDNSDIFQMIIKENIAMKFAFGQNPKFTYGDKKLAPATRMAGVSMIREALNESKEYSRKLSEYEKDSENKDKPDYDIKKEALLDVVNGKMPVKSHAHRSDDIVSAIKMAREFGFTVTVEHCTEGHLIVDYLAAENAGVIYGPILCERSKTELKNHDARTPGILSKAGVRTALMTDHPCVPVQYLPLCAIIAVKNGMDCQSALKAITITAAELAGISDRVGSLKKGKDADIIITDGDILNFNTNILYTIVNGKIAYEQNDL